LTLVEIGMAPLTLDRWQMGHVRAFRLVCPHVVESFLGAADFITSVSVPTCIYIPIWERTRSPSPFVSKQGMELFSYVRSPRGRQLLRLNYEHEPGPCHHYLGSSTPLIYLLRVQLSTIYSFEVWFPFTFPCIVFPQYSRIYFTPGVQG
jgi:hypothetical protein